MSRTSYLIQSLLGSLRQIDYLLGSQGDRATPPDMTTVNIIGKDYTTFGGRDAKHPIGRENSRRPLRVNAELPTSRYTEEHLEKWNGHDIDCTCYECEYDPN